MMKARSAQPKYWANTRPISLVLNFMLLLFYIADTDLQYTKILFPLVSVYASGSCTDYLLEYKLLPWTYRPEGCLTWVLIYTPCIYLGVRHGTAQPHP